MLGLGASSVSAFASTALHRKLQVPIFLQSRSECCCQNDFAQLASSSFLPQEYHQKEVAYKAAVTQRQELDTRVKDTTEAEEEWRLKANATKQLLIPQLDRSADLNAKI